MSECGGDLHRGEHRIEGAQADGTSCVLERNVCLAEPVPCPSAAVPSSRQIGIKHESPIDQLRTGLDFVGYVGEGEPDPNERPRIIGAQFRSKPCHACSFGSLSE